MTKNKTQATSQKPSEFLSGIEDKVKKLDDIDRTVLAQLIEESVAHIRKKYP
jgi:hypothetical protein